MTFGVANAKPAPEPNNLNDAENCAGGNFTMSFGSPKAAGWADQVCEDAYVFICKLQSECQAPRCRRRQAR